MKKYTQPELTKIDFLDIISTSPNADDFGVKDDIGDFGFLKSALDL